MDGIKILYSWYVFDEDNKLVDPGPIGYYRNAKFLKMEYESKEEAVADLKEFRSVGTSDFVYRNVEYILVEKYRVYQTGE
jgi:hypothetical protein